MDRFTQTREENDAKSHILHRSLQRRALAQRRLIRYFALSVNWVCRITFTLISPG